MDKAEIEKLKKQVRACLTEDCWNCPEGTTPDDAEDCAEALAEKLCEMIDASTEYRDEIETLKAKIRQRQSDIETITLRNEALNNLLKRARNAIKDKNGEIVELKRKLAGLCVQTENTSKNEKERFKAENERLSNLLKAANRSDAPLVVLGDCTINIYTGMEVSNANCE